MVSGIVQFLSFGDHSVLEFQGLWLLDIGPLFGEMAHFVFFHFSVYSMNDLLLELVVYLRIPLKMQFRFDHELRVQDRDTNHFDVGSSFQNVV